ncbi:MAG: hypothetical protein AMS23_10990 [Bacteroides sp. SM1_62]|nr:MAG: hypothetical protein AMS26_19375 [Bacteroides sp. SM23_62]KPL20416.1 MAG: hypothetical protein AMS23_10990 [Bacteroides sp. SM1_62]
MLQELKNLILGYPDNFGFRFDDEVFLQGLKFSFKEKYPWKSRKEMRGFFEKLYTHKSADSYQKIIEWKTILHQEQTHILYSRALILRLSSLIMISAGLVLIALQHALPSVVFVCTGMIMLICDVWFRRKASKSRKSWILITGLLKTLIEQQQQKHVNAA